MRSTLGARRRGMQRLALVLAACLVATSPACAAGWDGAIGFASDNVYRGISLTANRPAWLLDLRYEFGPDWVVGLAGSAERPPRQSASAQITAYLDRRWQLDADWAAKIGAIHYDSPGNTRGANLSYDELNAAIGYRGHWRASIALSPNASATYRGMPVGRGLGVWTELTYHQPIRDRLFADIGFGYADLTHKGVRNYRYGSAGLGYRVGDAYIYLTRIGTSPSIRAYQGSPYGYRDNSLAPARWVASVIWSFQGS